MIHIPENAKPGEVNNTVHVKKKKIKRAVSYVHG